MSLRKLVAATSTGNVSKISSCRLLRRMPSPYFFIIRMLKASSKPSSSKSLILLLNAITAMEVEDFKANLGFPADLIYHQTVFGIFVSFFRYLDLILV